MADQNSIRQINESSPIKSDSPNSVWESMKAKNTEIDRQLASMPHLTGGQFDPDSD